MSQKSRVVSFFLVGVGLAVLAGAGLIGKGVPRGGAPPAPQEAPAEVLSLAAWPITPEIKRGRAVYEQNCVGCHGEEGLGDGPAAEWLEPPPRNFQKARFKFRSSGTGQLPFDDDVFRTVTCGLPGSAMPGFPLVSERQRKDVVSYVLDLAVFNQAKIIAEVELNAGNATREQILADLPGLRKKAVDASLGARARVIPPTYPKPTPASIEAGRALYMKVCASCHGDEGRGDGSSSYALRDWMDASIVPRDFTSGVFRAGSSPADLYLRIRTGLNGTPMPSTSDPDENIWAMIHYILSVQSPDRIPLTRRMGCGHRE